MIWLMVAIGGAFGAVARFSLTAYLLPVATKQFPWGTLTANILGSALIGVCYVLIIEKQWLAEQWHPFLVTGFLGAFTTYSAFALESFLLWQQGQVAYAVSYALSSLLGCLVAVSISIWLMTKLLH